MRIKRDYKNVGPAADIYSLGVILFEIVSLQKPIRSKDKLQIISCTIHGQLLSLSDLVPKIPLNLQKIIEQCLAFEPQNRYKSVQQLAHDLEAFIDELPLKYTKIPLKKRLLSMYFGKQEYIRHLTPMDVEILFYSGIFVGIFIASIWTIILKFGLYSLGLGLLILIRPVYTMIFSKNNDRFAWFNELNGNTEDNSESSNKYDDAGIDYHNTKNSAKEIESYTQIIKSAVDHAIAHLNRGVINYLQNDLKSSLQDFTTAIGVNKNFAEAYASRALIFYVTGREDEAKVDSEKALRLNPDLPNLYFKKANPLAKNKKHELAIYYFQIYLLFKPHSHLARKIRAYIRKYRKNRISQPVKF